MSFIVKCLFTKVKEMKKKCKIAKVDEFERKFFFYYLLFILKQRNKK